MYNQLTVSVIIPAMNEAPTIGEVISQVPNWVDEIIVIDGKSTDGTLDAAIFANDRVIGIVQRSSGKGAAMSLGFAHATSDVIVIVDADGSMDFSELELFIKNFPQYQVVKGSRYLKGGGSDDITLFRSLGNRALTKMANSLFNQQWTDMAYGYAAFDRESIGGLGLTNYDHQGSILGHKAYGQGFEIETLIFTRAAKRALKILEIPSHERSRMEGISNLRAIRDGFRILIVLIVEYLRSDPAKNRTREQ